MVSGVFERVGLGGLGDADGDWGSGLGWFVWMGVSGLLGVGTEFSF